MFLRALGEETEKCRRSIGAIDMDWDYVAAIKGTKCEENLEMLQRKSDIALSPSSQSSKVILNHILSEGVNCLTI